MRSILYSLILIAIFPVLISCSNGDGPVNTGPVVPGPPPPGSNPGSTTYQLQCTIETNRTTGHAPLPVNLWANVIGGQAPFIFRWDVNSDGWWDYDGDFYQEIGIQFASFGVFTVLLEVEDANGQFYQATTQIDVKQSGPASYPVANPPDGFAPLLVTLDGTGAYDPDGFIMKWEWDFESDGVYDYESTTNPSTSTSYANPGTYNASLRVTDDDGLQDVASVQIVAL